jgi:hypothetical protein
MKGEQRKAQRKRTFVADVFWTHLCFAIKGEMVGFNNDPFNIGLVCISTAFMKACKG